MRIKVRRGASGWWVVGRYAPYTGHMFKTFDEALQYALIVVGEE